MKSALLLIAHGSREVQANDDLRYLAAEMRRRGGFEIIETAFLELAEPSIAEGCDQCVERGANRVIMLPYFLSAGVHVRQDLTRHRDELAMRFQTVEFVLAEPLGRHALLVDVVEARTQEALGKTENPPHSGIANTSSASST